MNQFIGVTNEQIEAIQRKLSEYSAPLDPGFVKELAETVQRGLALLADDIPPLPFFKERQSSQFRQRIVKILNGAPIDENELYWLAFFAYAATQEARLRQDTFTPGELAVQTFFDDHYLEFPPDFRVRIKYLHNRLPRDIFLQYVNEAIGVVNTKFEEQKAALTEPAEKIAGWDEKLSGWSQRVLEIEKSLKGQAEKLNFVGLSKAFSEQASDKIGEKRVHAALLVLSGVLLIALPFAPLFVAPRIGLNIAWTLESLPKLIPFAVSELVVLYIFRIFLRNYMSAKVQLVQLQLRKSLCAFVQTYAEFVAPLRKDADSRVLEKFEALIFSGISPDPQNVPSTFDGLEAVVQAVKEVKAK